MYINIASLMACCTGSRRFVKRINHGAGLVYTSNNMVKMVVYPWVVMEIEIRRQLYTTEHIEPTYAQIYLPLYADIGPGGERRIFTAINKMFCEMGGLFRGMKMVHRDGQRYLRYEPTAFDYPYRRGMVIDSAGSVGYIDVSVRQAVYADNLTKDAYAYVKRYAKALIDGRIPAPQAPVYEYHVPRDSGFVDIVRPHNHRFTYPSALVGLAIQSTPGYTVSDIPYYARGAHAVYNMWYGDNIGGKITGHEAQVVRNIVMRVMPDYMMHGMHNVMVGRW